MGKSKYKYLIENTGFLAVSSFSSRILIFLLVPFYTNVLSTSEYGIYDLATTTIQLMMPILTLNVYEGITRFLMKENSNHRMVISLGFKYVILGITVFGLCLWINTIFKIFPLFLGYEALIYIYFVSNLFYQFTVQCAKGLEKIKYMGIAGVINTTIMVIANIWLLAYRNKGLSGFFLSYILGQGIASIYLILRLNLIGYIQIRFDKTLQRELVIYSVPLVLNTIGWWINNASDRYVVTWICGVSINGIYSVSYKIPSILSTFQSIFTQSWQISAIREYKKEGYRKFYAQMLEIVNVIVGEACMILILFAKLIAKILYAKEFYVAWRYVPFLLAATVFSAAAGMVGPILSAQNNTKALGMSTLLGALANVGLNILLVSLIGAQGAAISTAISSFLIFAFRYAFVKNEIEGLRMPRFVGLWVLIIVQSYLMIGKGHYWMQIVLLAISVLISRKTIIKGIRILKK